MFFLWIRLFQDNSKSTGRTTTAKRRRKLPQLPGQLSSTKSTTVTTTTTIQPAPVGRHSERAGGSKQRRRTAKCTAAGTIPAAAATATVRLSATGAAAATTSGLCRQRISVCSANVSGQQFFWNVVVVWRRDLTVSTCCLNVDHRHIHQTSGPCIRLTGRATSAASIRRRRNSGTHAYQCRRQWARPCRANNGAKNTAIHRKTLKLHSQAISR